MNYKNLIIFVLVSSSLQISWPETLPSPNAIKDDNVIPSMNTELPKKVPGDDVIPNIELSDLKNKAKELLDKVKTESEVAIKSNSEVKKNPPIGTKKIIKKIIAVKETPEVSVIENEKKETVTDEVKSTQSAIVSYEDKGNGVRIFTKNILNAQKNETITLPSGSSVKATMLGGIEISNEERSIEARLDSVFLGPNSAVVEMNDCIVWMKLKANFNNERLYGKAYSISCRAQNGKTFELSLLAHVKGSDSYLGIKGDLIANGKMKAAIAGFLQEGISGYGNAVAKSQTTSNVVASAGDFGSTASSENVTGSDSKYIQGKTAAAMAHNRFLNWYLDYYSALLPTIAVAPGTQIYLSVEGEIQVPSEFFKNSNLKMGANTTSAFMNSKIDRGQNEN